MTEPVVDVLVVGAGPTGLALALQAHDQGAGSACWSGGSSASGRRTPWSCTPEPSSAEATEPGPEQLLEFYERERRPVARQVLALTHTLFRAEAASTPLASYAREALVPLAAPQPRRPFLGA